MSGRAGRAARGAWDALEELDRVASRTAGLAARRPELSKWSVGQHVEHLASANQLCLGAAALLVAGGDERIVARGSPTTLGRVVLFMGWIPRGRGRAPESTVPESEPDMAAVTASLGRGREMLADLKRDPAALAAAAGRLPHPVLGLFGAADWVRFTAIHTRHHLRIAAQISGR